MKIYILNKIKYFTFIYTGLVHAEVTKSTAREAMPKGLVMFKLYNAMFKPYYTITKPQHSNVKNKVAKGGGLMIALIDDPS